jgi:hypothetical protein
MVFEEAEHGILGSGGSNQWAGAQGKKDRQQPGERPHRRTQPVFRRMLQFAHERILRETPQGGVEYWQLGQYRVSGTGSTANLNSSSIAPSKARTKSAYETNIRVQTAGLVLGRRHFRRDRRSGKLFLKSRDQDVWARQCQEKFGRSPW